MNDDRYFCCRSTCCDLRLRHSFCLLDLFTPSITIVIVNQPLCSLICLYIFSSAPKYCGFRCEIREISIFYRKKFVSFSSVKVYSFNSQYYMCACVRLQVHQSQIASTGSCCICPLKNIIFLYVLFSRLFSSQIFYFTFNLRDL